MLLVLLSSKNLLLSAEMAEFILGSCSHIELTQKLRLGAWDILELPLLADCTDSWQNLKTQPWAPTPREDRHLSHWLTVESRGGGAERRRKTTKRSTHDKSALRTSNPTHAQNHWRQLAAVAPSCCLSLISFNTWNIVFNHAGPEDVTKQHFCKILWSKLRPRRSFKDRGTSDRNRQS